MKQMTHKEFKRICEEGKLVRFDDFGYEHILNMLCICYRSMSKQAEELGFVFASQRDHERADYVFNELEKRGFYND